MLITVCIFVCINTSFSCTFLCQSSLCFKPRRDYESNKLFMYIYLSVLVVL